MDTADGGVYASPAVVNGVVYFHSNNATLYALNSRTGSKLWTDTPFYGWGSPSVSNGIVYDSAGYTVYAFDASNGAQLWSFATGYILEGTPAVANRLVYVNSGDKNVPRWTPPRAPKFGTTPIDNDGFSSPAVANGVVYPASYSGTVYALNASTGNNLWSYRVGGTVESSPAVANGVVYIGSWDNNVYAFRLPDSNQQEAAPKCAELKMLRPDLGLKGVPAGHNTVSSRSLRLARVTC